MRRASPCAISLRLGGGRACTDLSDVRLRADALLGDGSDAPPAIGAVVDRAMAALAEAVGIMQTLLDTRSRTQKSENSSDGRCPPTR